jgi:hypothetical protein
MSIRYTVRCRFENAGPGLPEQWVKWLTDHHLAGVIAAGATSAEIIEMDAEVPTFEVRYSFASRTDWEHYLHHHAPRLRAEGLQRFPPELGLVYERSVGRLITSTSR